MLFENLRWNTRPDGKEQRAAKADNIVRNFKVDEPRIDKAGKPESQQWENQQAEWKHCNKANAREDFFECSVHDYWEIKWKTIVRTIAPDFVLTKTLVSQSVILKPFLRA